MRLQAVSRRRWLRRRGGRGIGSFGVGRETWEQAGTALGSVLTVVGAGPPKQSGWGSGGTGRSRRWSVTVHQAGDGATSGVDVEVQTSADDSFDDDRGAYSDWRLLSDWLHRSLLPHDVSFPFEVRADRWQQEVAVAGSEHRFTFVGHSTNWVAMGSVDRREITVSARGVPPVGLALEWSPAAQVRRGP